MRVTMGWAHAIGCLLIVRSAAMPTTAQPVLYVDDDATPGGGGSSWVAAYDDLQDALALADSGTTIRIAGGVYHPDRGLGDRAASFVIPDGVVVLGGYAGLSGGDPNERDLLLHETILSGGIGQDCGCVDDSYHVVTLQAVGAATLLDGVTIASGNADESAPTGAGGGIYASGSVVTLVDCTLHENRADSGGGVALLGGSELFCTRCSFVDNRVTGTGGAIYALGSSMTLSDCQFVDNRAAIKGGAISLLVGNLTVERCALTDNVSEGRGGAINSVGGSPWIVDTHFRRNHALAPTTGLSAGGGAIAIESGTPTLSRCSFLDNLAIGRGGGVLVTGGTVTIEDCAMLNCLATEHGGAISTAGSTLVVRDCELIGNSALLDGAAMYVEAGDVELQRSSFVHNTAFRAAGGLYAAGGTATITGGIFWLNTDAFGASQDAQICPCGGGVSVDYSCVEHLAGGFGGVGNFDADPLFADWDGLDDAVGTLDDDLTLTWLSPCLDAGDPNDVPSPDDVDLLGNPRRVCDVIDVGARERLRRGLDFNCSWTITFDDFEAWAACTAGPEQIIGMECPIGDADGDADLDVADFRMLQVEYHTP